MEHRLKILRPYYEAVIDGRKTFEIRDNRDRGFNAGDTVLLDEIYEDDGLLPGKWTKRSARADITYVTPFMQREGYVVFSIKDVTQLTNWSI